MHTPIDENKLILVRSNGKKKRKKLTFSRRAFTKVYNFFARLKFKKITAQNASILSKKYR